MILCERNDAESQTMRRDSSVEILMTENRSAHHKRVTSTSARRAGVISKPLSHCCSQQRLTFTLFLILVLFSVVTPALSIANNVEICTVGDNGPGRPLSFCMNNGTCKFKVSTNVDHPGCECSDAFMGPHCEIKVRSAIESGSTGETEANNKVEQPQSGVATSNTIYIAVGISVASVAGLLAVVMVVRRFRDSQREQANLDPAIVNLAPAVSDPDDLAPDGVYNPSMQVLKVDIGPQRDEDGHDLHDIELL